MDPITFEEYWNEVGNLARQITEEARERTEEIEDVLHETLDDHEWVIYTAHNFEVLYHCSDENAGVEEFGPEGVIQDNTISWAILAYAALAKDVREHSDFDADPED